MADCQLATAAEYATDPNIEDRLWALSEEWVGEKFALSGKGWYGSECNNYEHTLNSDILGLREVERKVIFESISGMAPDCILVQHNFLGVLRISIGPVKGLSVKLKVALFANVSSKILRRWRS